MELFCKGLVAGLLIGLIDCLVFYLSGQPVTAYDIASAVTFWSGIGGVVFSSKVDMPPLFKGIIISVVLNIPWAINFTAQGLTDYLFPIALFSVIFGALIGAMSKKFVVST